MEETKLLIILLYTLNISLLLLFLTKGNGKNQYIIKKNTMKKEMVIEIKLFNFFLLKVTFTNFCILYIWPGDFCL